MKKLNRFIIACGMVMLAACSKYQDIPDDGLITIKAVNPVLKSTTFDGVNVSWEKGDRIALFVSGGSGNSKSAVFETNISEPLPSTTFVLTGEEHPVMQDGFYLAVFPESQLYVWNSSPKMRCSMDLPFQQKVSGPGWDKKASLMAARSTTDEFVFKHCVAYLKFTITENSPRVISFSATTRAADELIASRVDVNMTQEAIKITETTPQSMQKTTASLSMEDGSVFVSGTYYLAILPKTYSEGFIFTFTLAGGKTIDLKVDGEVVMDAGCVGNIGEVKNVNTGSTIDPLRPFDLFNIPLRVSLLGDSISSYEGYIPSVLTQLNGGQTAAYYPAKGSLTDVSQTYWYKLIYEKMDNAVLDMNNSWRGTMVTRRVEEGYEDRDYSARCALYGLGKPDVVFIHGGTNDCTTHSDSYLYRPGMYRADLFLSETFLDKFSDGFLSEVYEAESYKGMAPATLPSDEDFNKVYGIAEAADTWDEILALEDRSFIHAYVKLLNMIHFQYSKAKVVMIIGDELTQQAQEALLKIAVHYEAKYGYKYVNFFPLAEYITPTNNAHPDANGFTFMANTIYNQVGTYIEK